MATQSEWFAKIKTWVPEWFWEQSVYNVAIMQAVAKVLALNDVSVAEANSGTFITEATGEDLDLHGYERNVLRTPFEFDPQYSVRIRTKSLISQCDPPDILNLINQLLIQGKASMREDFQGSVFYDREAFFNRAEVLVDPIENTFTIVVDRQVPTAEVFGDRGYFFNEAAYIGTTESSLYVFQLILQAVNDNKALGTFYRVIERAA